MQKNIKRLCVLFTFPFTKSAAVDRFAYSMTKVFSQIYSIFHRKVSYFLVQRD